jgi:hypothetical protein
MLRQARRGLQEGRGHKPLPPDTPHALPVQSLPVESRLTTRPFCSIGTGMSALERTHTLRGVLSGYVQNVNIRMST